VGLEETPQQRLWGIKKLLIKKNLAYDSHESYNEVYSYIEGGDMSNTYQDSM
jgi:hypothetical protein